MHGWATIPIMWSGFFGDSEHSIKTVGIVTQHIIKVL